MKEGERSIHRCGALDASQTACVCFAVVLVSNAVFSALSAVTTLRIKAQITPLKFPETEQLSDRRDNLLVQRSFIYLFPSRSLLLPRGVCWKRKASRGASGLAMKANGAAGFKGARGRVVLCIGSTVSRGKIKASLRCLWVWLAQAISPGGFWDMSGYEMGARSSYLEHLWCSWCLASWTLKLVVCLSLDVWVSPNQMEDLFFSLVQCF